MIRYIRKIIRPSTTAMTLAVVLLSSTLLSLSYVMITSIQATAIESLGARGGSIVVYSSKALTPYTGLISAREIDRIRKSEGILMYEMEVISPSLVNGLPAIARGVEFNKFSRIFNFALIEGATPSRTGVLLGVSLAKRIGAKPGDVIWVKSLFTGMAYPLRVDGIAEFNSTMDDELLLPLEIGQALRGHRSSVTLIRIVPSQHAVGKVASEMGFEKQLSDLKRWIGRGALASVGETRRILPPERFLEVYFARYGFSQQIVIVMSLAIMVVTSVCSFLAGITLVRYHSRSLKVLMDLGSRILPIFIRISLLSLPLVIAASALGSILGYLIFVSAVKTGRIFLIYSLVPESSFILPCLVEVSSYILGLIGGLYEIE